MAKYFVEDTSLTAVADAIRAKGGTSGTMEFPDGFVSAVERIQAGGGDDGSFKAVIERTATEITLPSDLTSIGSHAFRGCSSLALTSLPAGVTTIGSYAFYACTSLDLTSLPAGVTTIGSYAFYACSRLAEITFKGKPTTIDSFAFNSCNNLKTINVPWAEGEVANAPWAATKATINYNYTGG